MYPCNRIVYPSMHPQPLWLHIPHGEIFHWNFAHTRKNMFLFPRTLIFIGTFCENKMRSLRLCKCYFKFQHMDGPWGMRLVGWLVDPWSHAIPSSHQNVFPPLCCCLHLILILEVFSNSPREDGKSPSQFIKSCRRPKQKLNNTRCVQLIEVHRKRWVKFIKTPKKEHMRFLEENVRILSLYFC